MGKKSGPLAFLNKKGWHPGNQRNQEKVWKKEQEAIAEKKQVEELRKQYEEARQKEEVEAMAVAAGVKKKDERLDWMYQGGMVAKQDADKRADAQLMGEKDVDLPEVQEVSKGERLAELPTFYTQDTPASANEMWQRLHGDPMFAIKQQELASRKSIVANPVQMDAIKRQLLEKARARAAKKAAKAEAKAAKKAAKKAKKDKKRKRAAKESSSDSESDDEPSGSPKRPRTEPGSLRPPEREPSRPVNHDRHAGNGRHAHGDGGPGRREYSPQRNGGRHDRRAEEGRGPESHRDRDNDGRSEPHRNTGSHRHRSPEGDRGGDRHRDRERHGVPDGRGSRRDVRRHEESSAHRDSRKESRRGEENGGRARAAEREGMREERAKEAAAVKVHHDSASAQGRDLTYGLNKALGTEEEDREAYRRETERRLEEAKTRREAEGKEKASQRYTRKEHKTGRLSEEEKARMLAEMSGNAEVHEEARWARLQAARKRDDSEAAVDAATRERAASENAAPGRHHRDTAKFLEQATKETYGEGATLADRIGRRKYTNDRSRDEGRGAFQR